MVLFKRRRCILINGRSSIRLTLHNLTVDTRRISKKSYHQHGIKIMMITITMSRNILVNHSSFYMLLYSCTICYLQQSDRTLLVLVVNSWNLMLKHYSPCKLILFFVFFFCFGRFFYTSFPLKRLIIHSVSFHLSDVQWDKRWGRICNETTVVIPQCSKYAFLRLFSPRLSPLFT